MSAPTNNWYTNFQGQVVPISEELRQAETGIAKNLTSVKQRIESLASTLKNVNMQEPDYWKANGEIKSLRERCDKLLNTAVSAGNFAKGTKLCLS